MIKFIDISKHLGNVYNADIVLNGDQPNLDESYIFWFPEGQGVNIYYSLPICFVSERESVKVTINTNGIFKLVDPTKFNNTPQVTLNDVKYLNLQDIISTENEVQSIGVKDNGYYYHIIYILCNSELPGEHIEMFHIDNESFLVGADFYVENEPLYVNMSNSEVNIPSQIQGAIYGSNVRETNKDNILLNRKFKELISNYWNVIANKGSYKSLVNSLKWFEYGDLVQLREIWAREENGRVIYSSSDINKRLNNMLDDYATEFIKTTYYSLHLAKQKLLDEYDSEMNPIAQDLTDSTKGWELGGGPEVLWSWHDMQLKMALLGSFFETYFMPIHLNLMYSLIENIVFTNTFKIIHGTITSRDDQVNLIGHCSCNVQDGDSFLFKDVHAEVDSNTMFGVPAGPNDTWDTVHPIGVIDMADKVDTDDHLKQYLSQYYDERGCIVPFEFKIQLPKDYNDVVKSSQISTYYYKNGEKLWISAKSYKTFVTDKNGIIKIPFNILYTTPGEYEVRLQFNMVSGQNYIKNVKFSVIDASSVRLNVYKVVYDEGNINNNSIHNMNAAKYVFGDRKGTWNEEYQPEKQYISVSPTSNVKLHRVVIVKDIKDAEEKDISDYYQYIWNILEGEDNDSLQQSKYIIYISKSPQEKPYDEKMMAEFDDKIKKMSLEFIPQFHKYINMDDLKTEEGYTFTKDDLLCVDVELKHSHLPFKVNKDSWEFENTSTNKKTSIKTSLQPFIASKDKNDCVLEKGYYNITYNFEPSHKEGEDHTITIKRKSAFRVI